ncbi:MAG: methionine--tRNA ligase subunit beta, partial [Planctomycetaceae bacterium]|nr:methionine--tRNA ligase subunit beta [Planctomycetaceae bacterium]
KVHIHGFLTVGGQKMSKSDGTFVMASTYLKHLHPSYLRYYFASKLGPRLDDLDLNLDEFVSRINSDLVGKVVNIASRCAKFVSGKKLSAEYPEDGGLFAAAAAAGEQIAEAYERCDYNGAMRQVLSLADAANQYIENCQPWTLRKDADRQDELLGICSVGLNLFRQIVVYLAPVLPQLAEQTGRLLNTPITSWNDALTPLTGTPVGKFEHMMQRVDPARVNAMIEESREDNAADAGTTGDTASSQWNDGPEAMEKEPLVDGECTFDDFMKIDMRVARVIEAGYVEGADKLLQLTLSLGGDVRKNVFAGIRSVYNPEDLKGRLVICCANLAPRKMRFGLSEGMVLACGPGGKDIFLLNPDDGAVPGQRVH